MNNEYVAEVSKLSPPIVAAGLTLGGIALQDWVLIATLTYTILMTINLIYKFFRDNYIAR